LARATPAILRGASILNLLAAHPTRTFTLTDILKAVKMNRATLHAILAALVDVGYLYRANDKSYMLGPALIRIAHAAKNEVSPLQAAAPEIRGLADALDVVCTVVVRERDEMIIRDRALSASRMDWIRTPVTRFPLRPPLGSAFMAWASRTDLNRWLERMASMEERSIAMLSLEFVRARGYACGVRLHAPDRHLLETSSGRMKDTDFYPTALEGDRLKRCGLGRPARGRAPSPGHCGRPSPSAGHRPARSDAGT